MFNTIGFIPVPDTMTLALIVVAAGLMVAAAVYKNKKAKKAEFDAEFEAELARRKAKGV
jgi:hypothetical protein